TGGVVNPGTGGSGGGSGSGGPCETGADRGGDEYCHFPTDVTWTPHTPGTCPAPCTGSRPDGQSCFNGICYVPAECTPGTPGSCPPGHVCQSGTRTCGPPPTQCYFTEQCPEGWVCD